MLFIKYEFDENSKFQESQGGKPRRSNKLSKSLVSEAVMGKDGLSGFAVR